MSSPGGDARDPGPGAPEAAPEAVEAAANGLLSWRLVRGDERLKIFRGITALTEPLAELAPVLPDPTRALFCEVLVYLTRPRAMRLRSNAFYVMFVFNRQRRFCATATVRATDHRRGDLGVVALRFSGLRPAEPPEENPDPAAEAYPESPLVAELDEAYARPADGAPEAPHDCATLGPGAWWHFPSGRIYCWHLDETLLPMLPPGGRARHLGWLLARITNHQGGCEDCATPPHADPVNALWDSREVAEACPCASPCLWNKMARREVPVAGDASLAALLFTRRVDSLYLMGSVRAPRVTDDLSEVVGGRHQHAAVPLHPGGWRMVEYSTRASRMFACACPAVARVAFRGSA
ncbi:tegument protein UL16capsid maturation protease [Ateline alphaherpesvirus 1]|uniref:Tegument protein UL16capsid maturation protease n=1 Tax=Herpesvirus ateles type 1 (strain Lennette) TaxID=35243 RepID=A0A1S6JLQ2_HSVA1|nr:tegument protein UL16capsid maturation protease [Ateline alphaherpesvirus 1]AQS79200.1 tegument protein UL16capsid maturation protease [Ateline alphaherpesvirus 1]